MQLKTKQLKNGKWAVFIGTKYYNDTLRDTQQEAEVQCLYMRARNAQAQLDKIHEQLEKLGVIDPNDPHGYLA